MANIGEQIKKIRKEKGLSQKDLGKLLGVSQQMVGQYESTNANLQQDTINKISDALGVPEYKLRGFDGSIRVDMSSPIKAQEIENKINNNETVSKEELSWLNDYRNSHNLKEELDRLALNLDELIKKLSDSMAILYDQLNEKGQEKVYEYAKDLTQILEYQREPPEPPQE